MNLWHDISVGKNAPEEIRVVVEIPRGSLNKYEVDKETGLIALDRVAHTGQAFPFDYAFVPQTLWDDGDALDVIIFATEPFFPGLLVDVRPVGIMHMIDSGDSDDKVLAVPAADPRWKHVADIGDLNQHQLKVIQHFYEYYKKLQNKEVTVSGFEGKMQALEAVKKGMRMYNEKFPS
ncbi:MAG: inorganic pyrophosphatase [Candidatus Magasanikbacteria bacterium RIFCSPHIGHO2_01_FULL_41_23]|uniref:Inorganic pyrophosphatase n=1 Tax=Candidatus Magasanikbacteria bacterium RIFCSPLOWO2_01_FULL_40_15 TaxID=1798686 RepID=A0A1F6N3E0_9BACT|nr:MAG: inorganic pyrophosphatase [Candidatus Magasanikbacteria bacterium RIFCSPHIGHO2_01_FULL_41_23]OGH66935.1 MAG: inorganic pyrophosphatase [Candidatus Magasanikbacteria bacterium RIFCSPHIGHO2_02_FULL_41_35]OGH74917.1 MAG: inorganic pyrophosphatase [Candidatus Magasanikbacteria bacterium RIFCSPHIGHO2_12_FULL_41_16]OGH78220.1 MAG: inorganic pyrophosphatase [Candidatus Magasanikbacteria bacterium RIFCSPLOWO2_01_FULL_40_15]